MGHLFHTERRTGIPSSVFIDEPFFEDEILAELGWSVEKAVSRL